MKCTEANNLTMKFFDRNTSSTENLTLKQHLEGCKKCSDDYMAMNDILSCLTVPNTIEPPEDFERKVMDRVGNYKLKRRKKIEGVLFIGYGLIIIALSILSVMVLYSMRLPVLDFMQKAAGHSQIAQILISVIQKLYGFFDVIKFTIIEIGMVGVSILPAFIVLAALLVLLSPSGKLERSADMK